MSFFRTRSASVVENTAGGSSDGIRVLTAHTPVVDRHGPVSRAGAVDVEFSEASPKSATARAQQCIEHVDDLPVFSRALYDDLRIGQSLRYEVCPIEISPAGADGKRPVAAIVLLEQELRSDIVEEIAQRLSFTHEKAEPFYYVALPSVMVALGRGSVESTDHAAAFKQLTRSQNTNAFWGFFTDVVRFARKYEASDLQFEIADARPFSQVAFCIDDNMVRPREFRPKSPDLIETMAYLWQKGRGGAQSSFSMTLPQQTSIRATIDGEKLSFRWGSQQTVDGHVTTMRMQLEDHREEFSTLQALGFTAQQNLLWDRNTLLHGGGVINAGVVGSGKTRTLATQMSKLPGEWNKWGIEDPHEIDVPGMHAVSVARRMDDEDAETDPFIVQKRMMKRQKPHAVFIGEIRDFATASLFRDIAGAGLRALSSVHAPSAPGIADRLSDSELRIPRSVLGTPGFINLYVYQALIRVTCPHCALQATSLLDNDYLRRVERVFGIDADAMRVRNLNGCSHCSRPGLPAEMFNGLLGRTVVAEMFEPDEEALMLIREDRGIELRRYLRSLRTAGFHEEDCTGKSVYEMAMYKVAQGLIDPRVVEAKFGSFDVYEGDQRKQRVFVDRATASRLAATSRVAEEVTA
ncbi:Pilus assembly protein (plasmid) [Pararobbsia alpina]|uniref:ATPase, T2SS/T4P/T4SS family n=1 Tax=Pararobbsia alpina TaxID=621374 RepID=UPI0039A69913